jgi:hypothetical protein
MVELVEHFNGVLNRPSTIHDEAINRLPQVPFNQSLHAVPTFHLLNVLVNMLTIKKSYFIRILE